MRLAILPPLAALALSACGYTSPATLAWLNAQSPLEADPEALAVAVQLPPGVGTTKDGVVMTVEAQRSDTGEALEEAIALVEQRSGDLTVFRVPKSDLARLRAAQKTAFAWETEAPRASSGSFSVGAEFCATDPTLIDTETAKVSILIQTETGGPFLPLVTDAPVSEFDAHNAFDRIKPCEQTNVEI